MKLQPFSIGPLKIDFPVVLAGLAGYSDNPYRLICRRLGAPYCTTEVMLDKTMFTSGKLRSRLVKITDDDHPIAGQIIGSCPETLARAGEQLSRMGFDVIDVNLACPVRKVLRRRRGGFLMSQPGLAVEIIHRVIAAVDRPVTLKLRKGFHEDDAPEALWQIIEAAFDAGVAAICIHARSVEAGYTGAADWDLLAEVKRRFSDKTIIGSGDVLTPADALRMLADTGVDAVSAARGAIGNPWFFRQVADIAAGREPYRPAVTEQREVLQQHFAAACELYGRRRGPKIMRKFGIKYARMHPTPAKIRNVFINVKRTDEWQEVLDEFYTPDNEGRNADRP